MLTLLTQWHKCLHILQYGWSAVYSWDTFNSLNPCSEGINKSKHQKLLGQREQPNPNIIYQHVQAVKSASSLPSCLGVVVLVGWSVGRTVAHIRIEDNGRCLVATCPLYTSCPMHCRHTTLQLIPILFILPAIKCRVKPAVLLSVIKYFYKQSLFLWRWPHLHLFEIIVVPPHT